MRLAGRRGGAGPGGVSPPGFRCSHRRGAELAAPDEPVGAAGPARSAVGRAEGAESLVQFAQPVGCDSAGPGAPLQQAAAVAGAEGTYFRRCGAWAA